MNGIDFALLPERYQPDGSEEQGGFSDITFCTDSHLDRRVAIKTIQETSEAGRLRDEINALLSMRSKNVVQVFDLIRFESENIGIVLEYIDGDDLLESGFPSESPENYIKTLWQLACGISDIHNANIIHRDIKPNNMKLDREGVLKIFDFGLSRESQIDSATVGFRGTFGYAAPELFTSQNRNVTFTSAIDVYAFGVVALKLSGTELPDELMALPPRPLYGSPFAATLLNNYPELIPLLNACLRPDPLERPDIDTIKAEMSRHLLKDKHQALAVMNNKAYCIGHSNRKASISTPQGSGFEISYDGLHFYLENISGDVYMNSVRVVGRTELVSSCVVAIGPTESRSRSYITFDVSSPEVAL